MNDDANVDDVGTDADADEDADAVACLDRGSAGSRGGGAFGGGNGLNSLIAT